VRASSGETSATARFCPSPQEESRVEAVRLRSSALVLLL
jgi:hypothetical protein